MGYIIYITKENNMEDYSIEKLTKHIERAKTMGMPKEVQVLGDFVSCIRTKGHLTTPQKRYADSILGYTSASDLLMFLEYKDKLDHDEEYREKVRVISKYYQQSPYNRRTAEAALGYLSLDPSQKATPPAFRKINAMLKNQYAVNVWESYKAQPKFAVGDLVRLRSTCDKAWGDRKKADWMVISIGKFDIDTSHQYNEKLGGTKRYELLEVGGTSTVVVMEKHLKRHRVPKTKKRS
jgi:hypothetical protein